MKNSCISKYFSYLCTNWLYDKPEWDVLAPTAAANASVRNANGRRKNVKFNLTNRAGG